MLSQPVLAGSQTNICRNDLALPEKCRPQQVFILSPYGAETHDSSWPSILAKHQSPQVHPQRHMCFQTAKDWRATKSNVNVQKFHEESWLHLGICRIQRQADVKGWMFILATLLHWPDTPWCKILRSRDLCLTLSMRTEFF